MSKKVKVEREEDDRVSNLSERKNFEKFLSVKNKKLKEKLKDEKKVVLNTDDCQILKASEENKDVKKKRIEIYKKIFGLFMKHKAKMKYTSTSFFEELSPKMFELLQPIIEFWQNQTGKVTFKELESVLDKYFYVL